MISTFQQKVIIICIALLFNSLCYSQSLQYSFEDGSLSGWHQSDSGRWNIDTLLPVNGKGSLHHNFEDSLSRIEMIILPHEQLLFDSALTLWQFSVRYNLNPSASNNWSCWLINSPDEDESVPGTESVGYIVGVNYMGSDDFLKMWKKDNSGTEVLLSSSISWKQFMSVGENVSIKITRSITGDWSVLIDTLGSAGWINLGGFNDKSFSEVNYFGLYYEYTSSRDQKLWFDDLTINGYFYTDLIPPVIDSFKIIDRNSIEIYFNEPVDTMSDISFVLNNSQQQAALTWISKEILHLEVSGVFQNENILELKNISDVNGNTATSLKIVFDYYQAVKYDIIITEILADPDPSNGLPECEYIELYNRSVQPINIDGWNLFVGDKGIELTEIILNPKEYYLITKSTCSGEYDNSINKITFSSLPALINTGCLLRLKDKYGQLIDVIEYSDQWFESDLKKEGGWSLEMINTEAPCLGKENWSESISEAGGTPGLENSVIKKSTSSISPELISYQLINSKTIDLIFSKNMDSSSVANVANYTITPGSIHPTVSITQGPFYKNTQLVFENDLSVGTSYSLCLTDNAITDCLGNSLIAGNITFGIPELCDSADLIINEILFESTDYIPEFIEIYNNSSKIIDLKSLTFALTDNFSGNIKSSMALSGNQLLIFPGNYFVFTQSTQQLKSAFTNCVGSNLFEPETWMALPNDGGTLQLLNSEGKIIDMAIFNTGMHFSLLTETSGVSLERISSYKPANKTDSWHSASEASGYATPSLINSQNQNLSEHQSCFTIGPNEISPDNDGYNDILTIGYNFEKPSFTLSVVVYNINGQKIKEIVNNELCGTQGSLTWDGLDEDKNRLPVGFYILFIEAIHTEGQIINEKKTVLILPEKK